MKRYAVLTDSGCDVNITEEKNLGIYVLRMPVIIDDKEYTDGIDIDIDKLYAMMKKEKLAKTAQVSLGLLKNKYDELLESYDGILHIPISSGLSGQYQSAFQLAKDYDGRVIVVDAKFICYPIAMLARDAKALLDKGTEPLRVKEIIESNNSLEAIIIPSDINYLKMGGRISPAASSLANLLHIVPILCLKDGKIDVYDKVRTEKRAIQRGLEYFDDVKDKQDHYWMVIHDHRFEDAKAVAEEFSKRIGQDVGIKEFGPVILSHTGPETLAFGHFHKLTDEH